MVVIFARCSVSPRITCELHLIRRRRHVREPGNLVRARDILPGNGSPRLKFESNDDNCGPLRPTDRQRHEPRCDAESHCRRWGNSAHDRAKMLSHNHRRYRGVAAEACCTSWRGHLETLPQIESCRFLRWAWQTARHRWKIPLPSANCAAERCPKPTLTLQTVPSTPSRDVTVPPCGPFELTQGASRNQILPAR